MHTYERERERQRGGVKIVGKNCRYLGCPKRRIGVQDVPLQAIYCMPPNDTVSHRCSVIHVVGLECLVHYSMWPYVINVSGSSRTTHKTTLVIPCEVKKRVRKRQYPIFFSFFFSSEGVCLTVCAKICSIHIYVVLADK